MSPLIAHNLIKEIHMFALKYNMSLDIEWVPTLEQKADEASRLEDVREAIFCNEAFQKLQEQIKVEFTLDVFASEANKKTEKFVTRQRTPLAWAMDFFTVKSFDDHVIWAYPPKPLTVPAFASLQQAARKNTWCLVVVEFEAVSPIWPEIKGSPYFEKIEWTAAECPIRYPSKELGEQGYWRIPQRAKVTVLVHRPEPFKRERDD